MAIRRPIAPKNLPPDAEPVVIAEGMTADEYFRLPETTVQHNLIDGKLYMSPSPFARHQTIVMELASAVRDYVRVRGGVMFVSPIDCRLPDGSVLQPDVLYITPEREDIVQGHVMGAPDLVIEVLSRGTRRFDRMRKLEKYEQNGVHEAWLVDPEGQTVIVFTGVDRRWVREQSVLFGDRIPSTIIDIGEGGLSAEM
jgi:Uma2 family endonuclease